VQRHAQLLQVVRAGHSPCRFASGLDRRQEQCDQDADDGNHNQELDESKTSPTISAWRISTAHGKSPMK
jgi:hypothetical protein